jgi:hypothetical protein
MTKKYWWKMLTNEGMLVEPQEFGPYYDTFVLNEGPFDTVEQAEQTLEEFYKKLQDYFDNTWAPRIDYVLITEYSNSKE